MAIFKFRARNSETGKPIKAKITLAGTVRGYTPEVKDQWLLTETSSAEKFAWSAHYNGNKIDSGTSKGGEIEVLYTPS